MQNKWMLPLGLLIAGLIGFYYYNKYKVAPSIKPTNLNLVNLLDQPVNLADYHGEKTLLCFAASWCGPCRQELKMISKIKNELLGDVTILVISDEPLERIMDFKASVPFPFIWLRMSQPFSSVGINSIPTSYLLNRKGEVVQKTVGFIDWEDPSTARHLSALME